MIPFLALFNTIKKGAFKLPNIWRISDSRQTGKNKELSSGSGARPRALDRRTAFPGSGDWGDHTSGDRRTGRHSGKRDSAAAPHSSAPAAGLPGPRRGGQGRVFLSMNEACGKGQHCCFWEAPAPVSWQKWPSAAKQLRGSP